MSAPQSDARFDARFDVCAIGNALVDILVPIDDAFLQTNAIAKGGMMLVDDATAQSLFERAGTTVEMSSGGSAANSMAGLASLGGRAAYMGKVGHDRFGDVFAHDLLAQKITFNDRRAADLSTGRCLVLITPDAERSMCTFLGAATEFGPDDVDGAIISQAAITYLEGYLFDKPAAKQAFRKAAQTAHQRGRKMALSLSDTFCVARHREEFIDLISRDVDILFANQQELTALFQTDDITTAIAEVRKHVSLSVTTRGAEPTLIATASELHHIPVVTPTQIIDTTGAGDLYAAGFLFGLSKNMDLAVCGHIGAVAAAEVISHYGPRPQSELAKILKAA